MRQFFTLRFWLTLAALGVSGNALKPRRGCCKVLTSLAQKRVHCDRRRQRKGRWYRTRRGFGYYIGEADR